MQLHRWEELEVFFSLSNSVPEQNKSYTLLYTLPENIIRSELGIPEPRAEQRDSVKPRKRKLLKGELLSLEVKYIDHLYLKNSV